MDIPHTVTAVYTDLLGVPVAADDDFFAAGGHSMLAVIAIADLSDHLGFEVPLRLIFDFPVVTDLAAAIAGLDEADQA